MTLYPDDIRILLRTCEQYTQQEVDLETLKRRIWHASRVITAFEEKALHHFLIRSEAELDSIQFTNDDEKVFARTLDVVGSIIAALKANLVD
jgi:DUF438 domain-containing protein